MNAFRLTLAGATLALAVTAISGVAEATPRVKCDDSGRNQAQLGEECVSPTFPSQSRGACSKGACYRSGAQKHKKPKS